jgi:hypothetical protein
MLEGGVSGPCLYTSLILYEVLQAIVELCGTLATVGITGINNSKLWTTSCEEGRGQSRRRGKMGGMKVWGREEGGGDGRKEGKKGVRGRKESRAVANFFSREGGGGRREGRRGSVCVCGGGGGGGANSTSRSQG